jgi:hypothetical protein
VEVESIAGLEPAREQEMGGPVDLTVVVAPRPGAVDPTLGVLERKEGPVGTPPGLVLQRGFQRAYADDVQRFFQ